MDSVSNVCVVQTYKKAAEKRNVVMEIEISDITRRLHFPIFGSRDQTVPYSLQYST